MSTKIDNGPGTYFDPEKGTANVAAQVKNEHAAVVKTVAFLGGSITEMHGFRPLLMERLRAAYPTVEFREIAAGLSSTCSDAGAFRLQEDLLAQGTPDLLVIDEAVNDDQDGHFDRTHMVRGMEGIIRSVRRANSACEIVVALMVNIREYEMLLRGETPFEYAVHAEVANHYGAAVADIGGALAASARTGGFSWEGYRDCHPSPEGCVFVAKVVENAAKTVFDPLATPSAHAMPAPMDSFNYENARNVPRGALTLGEGWNISHPDWDNITGDKRAYFTRGDAIWSDTEGASLTVNFEGHALAAFLTAGPDAGAVEVSIDGGAPVVHTLNAMYPPLHYPYVEMLADGIVDGPHCATLRVRAALGRGTAVRIHRLIAS